MDLVGLHLYQQLEKQIHLLGTVHIPREEFLDLQEHCLLCVALLIMIHPLEVANGADSPPGVGGLLAQVTIN